MTRRTAMRLFLILPVLFFTLTPSLYAQKTRALTRIIKGEVEKETRDASRRVPAVLTAFEARVVDKSKLQYGSKQLSLMMERDRTLAEKMLSGEIRPEDLALEERLRKKVYGVLPPAISPTDEVHLSLAMLSSAETAKRLAKNGGGKRFAIMSPEAACRTYYARMRELAEVKKYVDTKLFYYRADGLPVRSAVAQERHEMMNQLSGLQARIKFLLLYYFPEDLPLYLANRYLTMQMIKLEPVLGGVIEKLPAFNRTDRVFSLPEFMLQAPAVPAEATPLPAGLRVAVVNDEEAITRGLVNFGRWGNFGAGAEVAAFDNIYKLLDSMKNGARYDVIFSDISMPEGNGMLLVSSLRENGDQTPVIGTAGYKAEQAKPNHLFELGFDGYIVSDNNGYRRAPEALKYYFYYKKLHHWAR